MTGKEKLSDAELSKKLGHYQKMSRIWLLVGLLGVFGGTVAFFAVQDVVCKAVLTATLFFGGICCALFLGGGAQKKLKALMQKQLGDFFRTEFRKTFGADLRTNELRIDKNCMARLHLSNGEWEECAVENFHESSYRGVHFSAANVRLDHVYERTIPHEGLETCRDMVFKGLVLRCETRLSASSVLVNARTEEQMRRLPQGNDEFDRHYCVTAERNQDAAFLLTPQLRTLMLQFDQNFEGRLLALHWEDSLLTLAIETDYGFAAVAGNVDISDLDAVRRSYVTSLHEMEGLLDLLLDSSELLFPQE